MNAIRIVLNLIILGAVAFAAAVLSLASDIPRVPVPIAFFGCFLGVPALCHLFAILLGRRRNARAALGLALSSVSLFLYVCLVSIVCEMAFRGQFIEPGHDWRLMLTIALFVAFLCSALLNTVYFYSALIRSET